ncbi:MAG: 30S ribosomal protein S2 [Nanoarchaeota archaeon]|nr:30S ribosomal protein S2 [Nanoarchaeota archaeon]
MAKIVEKIEKGIKAVEKGLEKVAEETEEKVEEGFEAIEESVKEIKKEIKEKTPKKKVSKTSLAKDAEKESLETEKVVKLSKEEIEKKRKELLAKVEKLKAKIEKPSSEELKAQVKLKKREEMLIPLEDYVRTGIYLGTRVVTPNMKPFVYRRRADGLAIFNTDLIDEKLKEAIEYLSKFNPEDVVVVCKREAGWKAVEKFSQLTGIRAFTKKYPAGILTNTQLPEFFENELTIISDSWLDKNALKDTLDVNKKVLMICDTNNFSKGAEQVVIGNNKSPKSLGVIFYILARGYLKARKKDTSEVPDLDWWVKEN